MSDRIARRVTVRGRVQGVFYRESCRQEAVRFDVRGWVRNEPDGSVVAHLEGAPATVERVIAWCRQGPPFARVESIDIEEADQEWPADFEIGWP